MMQEPEQSVSHELAALDYRRERIELLLSDGIVSPEMEAQLRQTLIAVERRSEALRTPFVAPAQRQAA
jgi:hypothetical protein